MKETKKRVVHLWADPELLTSHRAHKPKTLCGATAGKKTPMTDDEDITCEHCIEAYGVLRAVLNTLDAQEEE